MRHIKKCKIVLVYQYYLNKSKSKMIVHNVKWLFIITVYNFANFTQIAISTWYRYYCIEIAQILVNLL